MYYCCLNFYNSIDGSFCFCVKLGSFYRSSTAERLRKVIQVENPDYNVVLKFYSNESDSESVDRDR